MTYIILIAGRGTHLQPLTLRHPKSLYRLDEHTTVLQRMVRGIRSADPNAEIVVVIGYMYETIMKEMVSENVHFVHNPFFPVTGSIGSLWFAKQYLQRENVTIINGDVVMEDRLMNDFICQPTDVPYILVDSTVESESKYNVQTQDDKVCVMSRQLSSFSSTYASITKLDAVTSRFLLEEVESMINVEMYNLFFEDALVQMIFSENLELYYKDIKGYNWVEVDNVDNLLLAKKIHKTSKK